MYEDMIYDEYTASLTKNARFGLADQIYLELSVWFKFLYRPFENGEVKALSGRVIWPRRIFFLSEKNWQKKWFTASQVFLQPDMSG